MGCASCSNSEGGLPKGCKNNGSCGVSGCNKLEVFDWLSGMSLPEGQKIYDVLEIRFKNSRKLFYRNANSIDLNVGDVVAVEGNPGHDIGVISLTGELVRIQMRKKGVKDNHEIKKIYRKAHDEDLEAWQEARKLERDTMLKSRKIAEELGLVMKISDVEYQGDKTKATFYYTAEERVDFRQLIRQFADTFKVRIEMRQIGSRQEAARLGGIGSCGRELCCSTWLTDFRSVSTSAARYQQLALNPQKLAGQCGKLKCCLNYELDAYLEAINTFPANNTKLFTEKGAALHIKSDIFLRKLWYVYEDQSISASPICLDLDDVLEIIKMNKTGKKPADLRDYEEILEEEEEFYSNVVGQDSLTRFDSKGKSNKGRRKKKGRRKPQSKTGQGSGSKRPSHQKAKGKGPNQGSKRKSSNAPSSKGPRSNKRKNAPKGSGSQKPRNPKASGPNAGKRKK